MIFEHVIQKSLFFYKSVVRNYGGAGREAIQ